jgi:putative toxin-antitoxin system antitoxin component (TIGR02293 family)
MTEQLSRKERARIRLERRAKRGSGFSSYAGDRLVELQNEDAMQEVSNLVEETLGDREKAVRWLTKPHQELGDKMPLQLLQTEEGRQEVRTILGKIEHGIPG